jgi:hypothetical protein
MLIGLTALALALSAGQVPAQAAGLAAPTTGVAAPTTGVGAPTTVASVPTVGVPATSAAEPTDVEPVAGEQVEADRAAVRQPGGERAESDGAAWTHVARVGGRWTTEPTPQRDSGVADAARTAKKSALARPVGQRAPPRG